MATICRTSDGDILDTVCFNYYGHLKGSVEAVLDANQGLADVVQVRPVHP
ncbi:tail protein X, partial [Pseudomonas savastanoi]